jgi:hypothetical protein
MSQPRAAILHIYPLSRILPWTGRYLGRIVYQYTGKETRVESHSSGDRKQTFIMAPYFGFRGSRLNLAVSIIAGTDFLLFGYGSSSI